MMALLQRKSFRALHPILKKLVGIYLRKPRLYRYQGLKLTIAPSVFHPGLFYSTKFLMSYVETRIMPGEKVLELGAGSGLISLVCAKKDALVTSSDINEEALKWLTINAEKNGLTLNLVYSDLFDKLSPHNFDWIVINPPYYPKKPDNNAQRAWYCGAEFEYFKKLFRQLSKGLNKATKVVMVLSEDCDLGTISGIASQEDLTLHKECSKSIGGEINMIFSIHGN